MCMADIYLSTPYMLLCSAIALQGYISLQLGKLRFREVKQLARSHTAGKSDPRA